MGFIIGVTISAAVCERLVARLSEQKGKKPEHRMQILLYSCPFVPVGLLIYGWTVQARVFYVVPLIGTVFVGIGLVLVMVSFCHVSFLFLQA